VAQVAQHLGVKRVIARVNNPLNVPIFNRLGIRLTVSASQVLADVINQEVVSEQVRTLLAFPSGDLELVTLDLPADTPWRGRPMASLRWPEGTRPVAVVRQGHALVAADTVVLEGGDRLVLVAVPEKTPVLQQLLTGRVGARTL
jgi:trk system potassium uptake protein TrkA